MQQKQVEIRDILSARDERASLQQTMLNAHRIPLISFGMNIAGSVKLDEDILRAYREGVYLIENVLKINRIAVREKREKIAFTGCECIWAVDSDANELKRRMRMIEEREALGRLFDIDVIDIDGAKIARSEARRCLICSQNAHICARSRRHSTEELSACTKAIINDYFDEKHIELTAQTAQRALLYEALTTPKPGLVDCENNGSHDDMDIFSFAASACALKEYFKTAVRIGMEAQDASECLDRLQYAGVQAEAAMLHATSGVNTHKGALFSIGIACCAAGMVGEGADASALCDCAARIAMPSLKKLHDMPAENAETGGERQYFEYGYTGARGEAAMGFPTVMRISLPAFKKAIADGKNLNDAGLYALCALMHEVCDSNILRRGDENALAEVQGMAKYALENGAKPELLRKMNEILVKKNLSPGGSADLLALTCFLYEWENKRIED